MEGELGVFRGEPAEVEDVRADVVEGELVVASAGVVDSRDGVGLALQAGGLAHHGAEIPDGIGGSTATVVALGAAPEHEHVTRGQAS